MTKAESQANLAYPEDIIDASPLAAYPNWIDRNLPFREGFVNGYKQAEKDTIAEVEKWLKANFHHRNCWNEYEFCISLRTYFGIKK